MMIPQCSGKSSNAVMLTRMPESSGLRGEPGVAKILSGTSKLETMEVAGSREAEVNASIDRKLRSNSASDPGGAALGRQCLRAVL
jgi:hypothetical protein